MSMEATKPSVRVFGIVKVTFPNKGFFFITGEDGVKYFAHQAKLQGGTSVFDLWEGQRCSFVPRHDDPRGPAAEAIRAEE